MVKIHRSMMEVQSAVDTGILCFILPDYFLEYTSTAFAEGFAVFGSTTLFKPFVVLAGTRFVFRGLAAGQLTRARTEVS